jgi:hypothetical protein
MWHAYTLSTPIIIAKNRAGISAVNVLQSPKAYAITQRPPTAVIQGGHYTMCAFLFIHRWRVSIVLLPPRNILLEVENNDPLPDHNHKSTHTLPSTDPVARGGPSHRSSVRRLASADKRAEAGHLQRGTMRPGTALDRGLCHNLLAPMQFNIYLPPPPQAHKTICKKKHAHSPLNRQGTSIRESTSYTYTCSPPAVVPLETPNVARSTFVSGGCSPLPQPRRGRTRRKT